MSKLRELDLVKEGILKIRPDGFLGLRAFHFDDLQDLRRQDVDKWFERVAKEADTPSDDLSEIVWQFQRQKGGQISSPIPLQLGKEIDRRDYGRLQIRRAAPGRYEIVKARGYSGEVVQRLREIPLVKEGDLEIRSDGWIGLRALRYDELKGLRRGDIEESFEAVAKRSALSPQDLSEIVLQFSVADETLSFIPLQPGEESPSKYSGKLWVRRSDSGRYEVVKAAGHVGDVLRSLREAPLVKEGVLEIRSDGFLGFRSLHLDDLSDLKPRDIEGWFETVAKRSNLKPEEQDEIVWQFLLKRKNEINAPRIFRVKEEDEDPKFGKILIRRISPGRYEIVRAWGGGARPILERLKQTTLLEEGNLRIRSEGFLGLQALRLADLSELRADDIEGWFERVAQQSGLKAEDLSEIVWQFNWSQGGLLLNSTSLRPGEENSSRGRLRIRRTGRGSYEVIEADGPGAKEVIHRLRNHPLAQSKNLQIRSDGFLGLRAFRLADFTDLRKDDIEGWFEAVAASSGKSPQEIPEIVWRFHMHQGNQLSGQIPLTPGEAQAAHPYAGKIRIRRSGPGTYEVIGASGSGSKEVIKRLRDHPLVQAGVLDVPPDDLLFKTTKI